MEGIGKNEDVLAHAAFDVHPLRLVQSTAGWVVSTSTPMEQVARFPADHLALMGQARDRRPAINLVARTVDGSEVATTYDVGRAELTELIIELVSTFLDRDMFKQLAAILPEDWTR